MNSAGEPINALSVDVEDYFQVEAFADVVRRADWPAWPRRVVANTRALLDLFAERKVCGTFFVLGWVADHEPGLVREIGDAGHEIACHGFEHRPIYGQTPRQFRADIQRAKRRLEDLVGARVEGYRAPSYSITHDSFWAVEILVEEGFRYDSSIFPVHHDRYGIPKAERFPHVLSTAAGELVEFPPSTVRLPGANFNLPMAGGGYFRLFPYAVFQRALGHINQAEHKPAIFLVHPWEIDPDQPRIDGTRLNRWRHRVNLHRTLPRLHRLLTDFRFAPVRDVLAGCSELS